MLINLILSFLLVITYQLALTYIGVNKKFRDSLLPVSILAICTFISKIFFKSPPVIHTITLVFICTIIIHFFNKVDFLLSIIGSLLSIMTLTFSSLLIVCPLLVFIGLDLPKKEQTYGIQWFFLTVAEFIIPAIILMFLKIKHYSIIKYINS